MNILIWAPFIQKVGTTTNVINSITALKKFSKKNKYTIDLLDVYGEWSEYDFKEINVNKINLLNNSFLKKTKKTGFLRSRIFTILIIFLSLFPLFKLLKKNNYQFIFTHLITSLPIFLINFMNIKTKIILNIAGFPQLTFLRKLFWKLFQKKIYKIICPSLETKNLLVENNIFSENKLLVIKDPHINIKKIIEKKLVNLDKKLILKKNIISIGRLTKQKNYIFLINAFKKITDLDNNFHLTVIGEGEDRKTIEEKIKELKIEERVSLLGYQDNIYKFLKHANCYFSTSIWEGPDLAMLDAAYLNIPIICSDCKSGRKEFINNGERGYIFKTNDMNSLINEFKKFLNEDKLILKEKLIKSKKEVRNFTMFRYYMNIKKILKN